MAKDPIEVHGVRPVTWWLDHLLSGRMSMDEVPPAVASWSSLFVHQGALEVVLMDTKEERAAALNKVPAPVRPYVEEEIRRLWPMRRDLHERNPGV